MKKLLSVVAISLLFSCNSDDNNKECMCDVSYKVGDKPDTYTYINVEMDCNTRKPLENLDEKLPKGYKIVTFHNCNFDK